MVKADNWSKEPNVYREAFSFILYCSSTSSTAGGGSKVSRLLVQGWGWGGGWGVQEGYGQQPQVDRALCGAHLELSAQGSVNICELLRSLMELWSANSRMRSIYLNSLWKIVIWKMHYLTLMGFYFPSVQMNLNHWMVSYLWRLTRCHISILKSTCCSMYWMDLISVLTAKHTFKWKIVHFSWEKIFLLNFIYFLRWSQEPHDNRHKHCRACVLMRAVWKMPLFIVKWQAL